MKDRFLNIADSLYAQAYWFRYLGISKFAKLHREMYDAFMFARNNRSRYHYLTETDLLKMRKAEKVFIFGAGYSLNDMKSEEWQHISKYDTVSFNFPYQKWIDIKYHLIRGWSEGVHKEYNWRGNAEELAALLNRNPIYNNTILIVQADYRALFCNTLIGYGCLRPGTRIFPYKTQRGRGMPMSSFKKGLRHAIGNLSDTVNFAYCMRWKEIVLVGVDLYDSRYFWLNPDETINADPITGKFYVSRLNMRGLSTDQPHNTVRNGIVQSMGEWAEYFKKQGVEMTVYNPKSLLAEVMPIYQR